MKVAVLGLSLSSSWGNGHATTYRSLLKAFTARGHEVTFYERDQPWYATQRDMPAPAFCQLFLYRSLDELSGLLPRLAACDAAILGSYVPAGIEVAGLLLASGVRPLVFYDIDTPVTLAAVARRECSYLTPELIRAFDGYLSFSGGRALRLVERYGASEAAALYCSADGSFYRPLETPKRWDLGYLGTYSADRQPSVERLLVEPARRLPEKRFVVAGAQYPADLRWPENVDRIDHVPPEGHSAFYSSLRFALNVTRTDMIAIGHSPSVRLFEASACAVPVISDRWPGLAEFFTPGREILTAETTEDVVRFLASTGHREASAIGRNAYRRFQAHHEASRRAEQLETALFRTIRRAAAAQKVPA